MRLKYRFLTLVLMVFCAYFQGFCNFATLVDAAKKGNATLFFKSFSDMENKNIPVFDYEEDNGRDLLHYAAQGGNLKIIQFLAEDKKLPVNTTNHKGQMPQHIAAKHGNYEALKYLIDKENGTNLLAVDNDGNNLLHYASMSSNIETVRYLIENLRLINYINSQGGNHLTPLQIAAINGNVTIFFYLIEKGADINKKVFIDENGCIPPRALLTGDNNNDLIYNCEIDEISLLFYAAIGGNTKIITFLIDKKFDVNETSENCDITPLYLAAKYGKLDAFKLLIEKGAHLSLKNYADGTLQTIDSLLTVAYYRGSFDIVKYMLETSMFDIEQNVCGGCTLLQLSAQTGNAEEFMYLIEKKAKVNNVNHEGEDLLLSAIIGGNIDIVKFLVENKKFDVNKAAHGVEKPLQKAVRIGNFELFNYLLKHGANLYEKNNYGQNLLHIAVASGNLDIVKFLIKKGFNVNEFDNYFCTPMKIAMEQAKHYKRQGRLYEAQVKSSNGIIVYLGQNNAFSVPKSEYLANRIQLNKPIQVESKEEAGNENAIVEICKSKWVTVNNKMKIINFLLTAPTRNLLQIYIPQKSPEPQTATYRIQELYVTNLRRFSPKNLKTIFSKILFDRDFFSTPLSSFVILHEDTKNLRDKKKNNYYEAFKKNPSLIKYSPIGGLLFLREKTNDLMDGKLKDIITTNMTKSFLKDAEKKCLGISNKIDNLIPELTQRRANIAQLQRPIGSISDIASYLRTQKRNIQQSARNLINTTAALHFVKKEGPLKNLPPHTLLRIIEFCGMDFGSKLLKINPDYVPTLDPDKFWNVSTK